MHSVGRVPEILTTRADEETIQVWQKDPNVHACIDLLNRALDKPAEQSQQLEHTGKDSGPLEIIVRKPWDKK